VVERGDGEKVAEGRARTAKVKEEMQKCPFAN
jgi:hypothetical protein